jgi:hypothetical protein
MAFLISATYKMHALIHAYFSSGYEDDGLGRGRGAAGQGRYGRQQGRRDLGRSSDARWEDAGWGRGTEMDIGPDTGAKQAFGLFTQDAFEYVDPDPFAEDGARDFDFFAPPTRVNAREEGMRYAGLGDGSGPARREPMGRSSGERGSRAAVQGRKMMQPERLADMRQPGASAVFECDGLHRCICMYVCTCVSIHVYVCVSLCVYVYRCMCM